MKVLKNTNDIEHIAGKIKLSQIGEVWTVTPELWSQLKHYLPKNFKFRKDGTTYCIYRTN